MPNEETEETKETTPHALKSANENTNTVMLVTHNGDYMACDTNNELYFTINIIIKFLI